VAAVMYILKIGDTRFDAGFNLGISAFTAAMLGGIGNLRGALLGGLVLGVAENYGAGLFGTQWHQVVSFVLLVLVLMFRPTGILGESLGREGAGQKATGRKQWTESRGVGRAAGTSGAGLGSYPGRPGQGSCWRWPCWRTFCPTSMKFQ